ncbi:DNA repair protein RecN [Hydrogenoanaerobacterium sp.]|uniref:DNA repair protein RecN n=1 Tax=Hydrogenoanaerobacterium sp. TaxID=2953763 RepID=UPI0028965E83|nr:DNA repair protein RecN [Hydrogenoanaerobacterium sp.]
MLTQLYIQNIAVIEKTSIEFQPGFNIFTGETGAGKSILIDAISAVLGFRTSRDLIRTGADKAIVTALFDRLSQDTVDALAEFGYEPEEDGSLLLSREFSAEGKNTCKIGGRPATVSILREVAQTLINIHGQHDNQALMAPDKHIKFIDSFADTENLLASYRQQYAQLQDIRKQLEKLNVDEAEKAYRIDLLTYQIDEISDADLKPGEEEELIVQKKRIGNSAKIVESITQADAALNGDDESEGLVAMLGTAKDAIAMAGRYFTNLEEMAARVDEIYYELREYASDIRNYTTDLDFDEGDIDRIELRLDTIYKLKHKYGSSVEEILSYLEKSTEELSSINHSEELQQKLNAQLAQVTYNAQKMAEELSERRQQAAILFTDAVGEELKFLDMPFVRLEVKNEIGALSADGIDNMEFMISTNPGEPPKPLSKIASGGELSRIMLSLKNVIADKDQVGTLIFDEIDTGVSGRAAQKIGQKLAQVSKGRQIICVTHLAQVASYADNHLLIEKNIRNARTYTEVHSLDKAERIHEIARIIGGADITDTVLKNAEEMLRLAEKQA